MLPDHVRLRFVRPHGAYRKGDTIEYPRGPAKTLVATGACEIVPEDRQLLEVAMVERREAETADAPRRRGRKPK